jgi:SAM-dependent methyltransferase
MPEKFDLVCLFDVLEHVEADEETLAVTKGLLAPAGVAVITVPAFAKLWGPHDEQVHHKRRYERVDLEAKLLRAGFQIRKLSYCNMFLFPAAVAARIADKVKEKVTRVRSVTGTGMLPAPINRGFSAIFGAERFLLERVDLPIGLSLLAVVQAS